MCGIPLVEYVKGEIYRGILTGLTEAFVFDDETRKRIIKEDKKSEEIIKPFVIGNDIRKYHIDFKNKFLILIPKGWTNKNRKNKKPWEFLNNKYPLISKHLAQFEEKAKKRCDKGDYWWELRACDYYDKFERPKIIFPDIAKESRMSFDENGLFIGNTAYIIPIKDFYLLGILNSRLIFFYYKRNATVLGDADKGGRLRWIYQDVKKIPIKKNNLSDTNEKLRHDRIVELVKIVLDMNKKLKSLKDDYKKHTLKRQIDVTNREIEKIVYEIYGLTEEEIKVVEGEGRFQKS